MTGPGMVAAGATRAGAETADDWRGMSFVGAMCGVLTCQSPSQFESWWGHPRRYGPNAGMVAGRPLRAYCRGPATRWRALQRARQAQGATQRDSMRAKLSSLLQAMQTAESCRQLGGQGPGARRQTSDGGSGYKLRGRQQCRTGRGRRWERRWGRWRQRQERCPRISCHEARTWQERWPRDTQGSRCFCFSRICQPISDTYCLCCATHTHRLQ